MTRSGRDTRERVTALLRDAGDAAGDRAVTACPDWTVRGRASHQWIADQTTHEYDILGALRAGPAFQYGPFTLRSEDLVE